MLLIPLAATSTTGMIRRLGGSAGNCSHRLIYVSAIAGVIHYWWLVKANVSKPELYALLLSGLLGYRVLAWWLKKPQPQRQIRAPQAEPASGD